MMKTLDYYLELPYTIEVTPDGDAWVVRIKKAKRLALERRRPIPNPQPTPA